MRFVGKSFQIVFALSVSLSGHMAYCMEYPSKALRDLNRVTLFPEEEIDIEPTERRREWSETTLKIPSDFEGLKAVLWPQVLVITAYECGTLDLLERRPGGLYGLRLQPKGARADKVLKEAVLSMSTNTRFLRNLAEVRDKKRSRLYYLLMCLAPEYRARLGVPEVELTPKVLARIVSNLEKAERMRLDGPSRQALKELADECGG